MSDHFITQGAEEVLWRDGRFPGRVDPSILEGLRAFPSTALGDAMGRISFMDGAIRFRGGRLPLVGQAVTVDLHAGDNLGLHRALEVAREGDVLVVAAQGDTTSGMMGELLLREALRRRLGGVIIDGAVRDVVYVENQPIPVFARATSGSGALKGAAGRINWPVAAGGVAVSPGDLVVGDRDGVAVIPRRMGEEVLSAARLRVRKELQIVKALGQGRALHDLLDLGAPTGGWDDEAERPPMTPPSPGEAPRDGS